MISMMNLDPGAVDEIIDIHEKIGPEIRARVDDFRSVWISGDSENILLELLFCILTPQSKAKVCWGAVEEMRCRNLILKGDYEDVLDAIATVRFKYRKASFIIRARDQFTVDGKITLVERLREFDTPYEAREWLAENVKGYGYKEAGHFLRNIGLGEDLAILDRHILKNLRRAGVISEIPPSMSPKRYLEIEGRMKDFSRMTGIPLSHLDLILWYRETGEIFK
jgi:N-glycosylase/DNA lyase